MCAAPAISQRHTAEADLMTRAIAGDRDAADACLDQLGSDNKWLQHMMMEAMGSCTDVRLWQRLLTCLALHRWGEYADHRRRADGEASKRIDAATVSLFVQDAVPEVAPVKLAVLHEALTEPECRVRNAAATLLGLRGDPRAIEALVEVVRSGEPECKLRAVAALGRLNDERAGWLLIEALALDDERVHHEAGRALSELGDKAVPALIDALQYPQPHVRWHAARALGSVGDVRSTAGLLEALTDNDSGVRWAAADALVAVGEPAVPSILEWLSRHTLSEDVRQAVYHALHQMPSRRIQAQLQPVLDALRSPASGIETPGAAYRLLQTWESRP